MATVMSQMPDVWQRALAEHVPDGARHCRACCSPTGVQASWPCQTFKVADEARLLAEGYLPVPSAPVPREPISGSHRSYDPGRAVDRWGDTPSWESTPSWASEPPPVPRGREIADLPVDPREPDPWDRDDRPRPAGEGDADFWDRRHRDTGDDRRPWSFGASFGPDPWSR